MPFFSHSLRAWENSYRWGLDDSAGLDDFLLVQLGAGTVEVTNDGGHTSLVTHVGGKVDGLLGVILGEAVLRSMPVDWYVSAQ